MSAVARNDRWVFAEMLFRPGSLLCYCNISSDKLDTNNKMLLPQLQFPIRATVASVSRSPPTISHTTCLNHAFAQLAIRTQKGTGSLGGVRWAHHKAQGAVNKAKDGPGKRLGAKKSGGWFSYP